MNNNTFHKDDFEHHCETVLHIINKTIASDSPVQLSRATVLAELDIDSIDYIKIIVAIEDALGIEFEDEKLSLQELPTIQSMLDYIKTRLV